MMFGTKRIIWLGVVVALLQSGALYAMVEQRASILRNGTDITLLTEPVDPRDLLRGDYVTLGYDISDVKTDQVTGEKPQNDGLIDIYVILKRQDDGRWSFASASWQQRTDVNPDEVQLRGKVLADSYSVSQGVYRVRYGIERYYVPEGQGKAIEDQQRQRKIEAVIAVSAAGDAQIRALKDDGNVLYEEPMY